MDCRVADCWPPVNCVVPSRAANMESVWAASAGPVAGAQGQRARSHGGSRGRCRSGNRSEGVVLVRSLQVKLQRLVTAREDDML